MRLVYHRKIGTRLGYGFGIIIVLMILLGTIAIIKMNKIAAVMAELYEHPLVVSSAVRDIRAEVFDIHGDMKDIVSAETAERLEAKISEATRHEQNILNSFKILFEQFLGDKTDIEAAQKAFLSWKPIRQEIIELVRNGKYQEASHLTTYQEANQVDQINERMLPISEFASMKANQFFSDAQNSKRHHLFIVSGMIALITGICILWGIIITRSITEPVRYIIGEISKVGDGNLDHKINLKSRDEIGQLAQAFDDMTENLKRTTASRNELNAANQQLNASNQQLRATEQQLRADEEQLKKLNHDMAERVKELDCMFGLSELIEQYGVDTEQVFKGLVDLIPPAWQYPDITCTRIIFENREFKTTNFKPTKWLQSADINIAGKKVGLIEICCLEEMPAIDEGPFLAQERKLLDATAHRLGKLIEHRKTTEQIKAVNQQLRASNLQLQATEQQLRAANQQLRGEEQQLKALTQQLRASNQQLQATEQQLRAANQQLKAEGQQLKALNQQLRASNQQLQATEQQLRAANQQLRDDEEQLKKNHEQLRTLAFKLSSIEERERKHIAEGIHGSIIQPLVFLDVKVKSLGKITKDTKLTEAYRQMRTILGELIEKSRTFTFDLSYPILYELGLEPAIEEWLRTEIKDKHKIAVEFKSETPSKDLDQNIVTFLFKSVKELMINIVKHAKANNVRVSVAGKQNNIILCVEDDGCGFESFRSGKKQTLLTGFGLFNIREQVTYLGGELSIDSKAGIGSKITLTVPLEDKA